MPMDEKTKISLLGNEYSLLQQFYEDFDKRILGIKGWSATIAIAAIGGGFYQTRLLWLFAAGASLVFWLLETIWKGFQYCYSPRIELLERAFREDKFENVAPFQIGKSWYKEFQKNGYQMFGVQQFQIANRLVPTWGDLDPRLVPVFVRSVPSHYYWAEMIFFV
jgi:hypothetical protein